MADNIPDYSTADDLIRSWFTGEAQEFGGVVENLREVIGQLVFSAYLKGHEDGYEQGERDGYNTGQEIGKSNGYDEGYDDAKAEFEANEW